MELLGRIWDKDKRFVELAHRPKRQALGDPKAHHDAQISYLLAVIPFYIDKAKEEIEIKQKKLVFYKIGWGWSIIIAGLLDFYSNFLNNNRTLGNFGDVSTYWGYGMTGFYAVGFGFPYLLDLPEDRLKCGAANYLETLDQYKLTNGLDDLFQSTLPISDIKTIVAEFDSWARIQVGCISDFESDLVEAAEVGYLFDELNAAMNVRIDLEEASRNEMMSEMMNDVMMNEINDEMVEDSEGVGMPTDGDGEDGNNEGGKDEENSEGVEDDSENVVEDEESKDESRRKIYTHKYPNFTKLKGFMKKNQNQYLSESGN